MKLFAISDLHIKNPEDPLYFQLIQLINTTQPQDILVLGGDIFDFFVGVKSIFTKRYHLLLDTLNQATSRNVEIHYLEGNHDFLLAQAFEKIHVKCYSEELKLTLAGKHFFFAHGDLANPSDYGYRALRIFLRSFLMRIFFFFAPGTLIDWIGTHCVKKHRSSPPESIRTIYRNYAAQKMTEGADFVILGHCHDLDEMLFRIEERFTQYINIGYPPLHGSFLFWTPEAPNILRKMLQKSR